MTQKVFILTLTLFFYCIMTSIVYAAPSNNYLRGPHYTISNSAETQKQPFVEVRNSTYHGVGPREEARAMCSVKTHEVNATANATITRRLHGVVTSNQSFEIPAALWTVAVESSVIQQRKGAPFIYSAFGGDNFRPNAATMAELGCVTCTTHRTLVCLFP